MNVSVFIGRRLSFRGSPRGSGDGEGRRRPSPGVPIAVGGIAIAVVIMMVSISVVMGFKDEIRRKVTGFTSEVTVFPQSRTLASVVDMPLDGMIDSLITSVAPGARIDGVVEVPGILKTDSAFQGVMVKAYAPGADGYRFIASNLVEGSMPADANGAAADPAGAPAPHQIAVSQVVASKLGLATGDNLFMHFVSDGSMRTRKAVVAGIYDTHLGEYDSRYVYAAPVMARGVAAIAPGNVTSVEVNGIAPEDIPMVSADLQGRLLELSARSGGRMMYGVDNVLRSAESYFSWLELLDTNVAVILTLMALVSGFTLISCLFILILERVSTIGILKSLGATNGQIRRVFIYMACRLVARGLVIGNVAALALLIVQHRLHLVPLDAESYFLSYVPVALDWGAFALLNVAVAAVSALVLILPSHLVATLSPSESMRYE